MQPLTLLALVGSLVAAHRVALATLRHDDPECLVFGVAALSVLGAIATTCFAALLLP